MVTLANPVIRCIVRELTDGGQTTETYDFALDYAGNPDGVTSNNTILQQFNTDHRDKTNTVRLYMPEGVYEQTFLYPLRDFKKGHILGEAPSGGVWPSQIGHRFFVAGNGGPGYTLSRTTYNATVSNTRSLRLEYVTAGDTVVTVKNRDITRLGRSLADMMALYSVGDWVLIGAYDLQGNGGPVNLGVYEFRQIVAKGTDTFTLSSPLENNYPDDVPEYDPEFNGGAANWQNSWDLGGPATLYHLDSSFETESIVENIQMNVEPCGGLGKKATIKNCNVRDELSPTCHLEYYGYGTTVGSECEFDKLVHYFLMDDMTFEQNLLFQSSNNIGIVRNSSIDALLGSPKHFTCEDSTIGTLSVLGPSGYGHSETATFTRVAFDPANAMPGVTHNRAIDFRGTFFDGNTIKGFNLEIHSYPGHSPTGLPLVGETITGAGGATGVVLAMDGNVAILDAATVTGTWTRYEAISSPSFSGQFRCNAFGREWAVPGCKMIMRPNSGNIYHGASFTISRFYQDVNGMNCVETDISSFPSYTVGPLIYGCPLWCQSLTVNDCTGNKQVDAWNEMPDGSEYGSWSRFWLGTDGAPTLMPPIFGTLVSYTVDVTRAYTGSAYSNLYLALGQYGPSCIALPAGTIGETNDPRCDLKTVGTRVWSPSGNTGILASDREGTTAFMLTSAQAPKLLTTKTGNTIADISGESSALWPEFTVTIVTEV